VIRAAGRLLAFIAAAGALALAGCGVRGAAGAPRAPLVPVPLDAATNETAAVDTASSTAAAAATRPRISIDPTLTVLKVVTTNLDEDAEEEQVIAVKNTADVSAPVRVLVADADPGQGTYYYQSWEGETLATDTHQFSLSIMDVVGDHTSQIVVNGMDESGQLTLDIFHPVAAHSTKGLAYRPVFQVVADELSILEADRPDSYSTDQQPGPSFPIQVYLRDTESPNQLDLRSIVYAWRASEARYVPGPAQKIPGADVQQQQLKVLYLSRGEDAFERFIAGSWVQDDAAEGGSSSDAARSIIDFDTRGRKISVATGTTAEDVYDWTESHRTIPNTLRVVGENVTVPKIRLVRRFTITADTPSSITVKVTGEDTTETTTTMYTKITDEQKARLLAGSVTPVGTATLPLKGAWVSAGGPAIEIDDTRFAWEDTGSQSTGSYVVFTLGSATILTTRLSAGPSAAPVTTSWLLGYKERKDGTSLVRTLSLSAVVLTVAGYEDANGPDYVFTQTVAQKKGG
jgi:hypothetical protein